MSASRRFSARFVIALRPSSSASIASRYSVFFLFYNSIVVIGDDGVLITDPANDYRAGVLKDEIAKLTDRPVSRIVLTHEHFDHTGGTEVFPEAQIIAQENVEAVFAFDPLGAAPDKVDVTFAKEHSSTTVTR